MKSGRRKNVEEWVIEILGCFVPHNGLEQHDDNGVESDLGGGLNYLNVVGSSV